MIFTVFIWNLSFNSIYEYEVQNVFEKIKTPIFLGAPLFLSILSILLPFLVFTIDTTGNLKLIYVHDFYSDHNEKVKLTIPKTSSLSVIYAIVILPSLLMFMSLGYNHDYKPSMVYFFTLIITQALLYKYIHLQIRKKFEDRIERINMKLN